MKFLKNMSRKKFFQNTNLGTFRVCLVLLILFLSDFSIQSTLHRTTPLSGRGKTLQSVNRMEKESLIEGYSFKRGVLYRGRFSTLFNEYLSIGHPPFPSLLTLYKAPLPHPVDPYKALPSPEKMLCYRQSWLYSEKRFFNEAKGFF